MDSMYLPIEASYNGLRTIDVNKLKFRYSGWIFKLQLKQKLEKEKDFQKQKKVKSISRYWFGSRIFIIVMHNDYFCTVWRLSCCWCKWTQAKALCMENL
jgi:hypothetical protein